MNTEQLRRLSGPELEEKLTEAREEIFNLRFRHSTAQLENTAALPEARKNKARIMTILKEREKEA